MCSGLVVDPDPEEVCLCWSGQANIGDGTGSWKSNPEAGRENFGQVRKVEEVDQGWVGLTSAPHNAS